MSKRFKRPIADYQLGRFKPMAVELDSDRLGRYRDLTENPIYYYNALQFIGGGFYRAVLGYEVLWDRKAEGNLELCLDYVLTKFDSDGDYYLEEVEVGADFRIHGIKWPRGVAPRKLFFELQWPFSLKKGERLTARVNLLDKPNHVDIERKNGEVFTIPFVRFQNCFNNGTFKRRKGAVIRDGRKTDPKTTANGPQSRARARLSLVNRFSRKNAAGAIFDSLPGVRKRLGG